MSQNLEVGLKRMEGILKREMAFQRRMVVVALAIIAVVAVVAMIVVGKPD